MDNPLQAIPSLAKGRPNFYKYQTKEFDLPIEASIGWPPKAQVLQWNLACLEEVWKKDS